MLVHQLPPAPSALRVRIWRRLQEIGALPLRGAVYLLPESDEAREDFEWLVREITAAGAEAALLRAALLRGASDQETVERFRAGVEREYEQLATALRLMAAGSAGSRRRSAAARREGRELARLRKRFAAIVRRDYFGARGGEIAGALLAGLQAGDAKENTMAKDETRPAPAKKLAAWRGKTWVTRSGVKVDRMATAWLVKRHVDPAARFRFVDGASVAASPGTVRFDMFDGEVTHEDDRCTFETLLLRLGWKQRGLVKIGEIIHDLDLKEERFAHPEAAGVAAALEGIVASTPDDAARIERASVLFDSLLARFSARR